MDAAAPLPSPPSFPFGKVVSVVVVAVLEHGHDHVANTSPVAAAGFRRELALEDEIALPLGRGEACC